ncbi:MAG: site-specific DNA-methyltransferase [Chloroflexaceae bacterium]|jgi:hypothetical protein|nr:site-specific DNA-methyltransferase [Chloroflexaceae bacterium]
MPLNTTLLLEALQQIRATPSLESLRHEVALLVERLYQPADAIHVSDEGEADGLSLNYVLAELQQISASFTLERAVYYTERLVKAASEVRSSAINDLNLNRWKEYDDIVTDSLWLMERRDSSGAHTAGYWGNFIPQIPNQLLRRFTKRGEWVLDAFAGSGTTLLEAQRLGRNCLGIELQAEVATWARQNVAQEPNKHNVASIIHVGDSSSAPVAEVLAAQGVQSVQLALLHPPYHDIIRFSEDGRDLSNAATVEEFLAMLGRVVANVAPVLDKGRYLALVIGDKYVKGEWVPLGFRAMEETLRHGFMLKSIIVKNFEETTGKRNQKELWRYRALVGGFYIFKHEYVFLFRKK